MLNSHKGRSFMAGKLTGKAPHAKPVLPALLKNRRFKTYDFLYLQVYLA